MGLAPRPWASLSISRKEIMDVKNAYEVRIGTGLSFDAERGERNKLVGYASVFNSPSEPIRHRGREFREIIAPGAFRKDLEAGKDIRAFIDHDSSKLIGRRSANTLRLEEDSKGLRVEIDLPNTQEARDLKENMFLGNIDQMSVGFLVREGGESFERRGGHIVRTVTDISLIEVSVVSIPAYSEAKVDLRSLDEFLSSHPKVGTPTSILRKRLELIK